MARGTGTTNSWALDRIDQISSLGDNVYNPGTGRDGSGVDIYIFDTGLKRDKSTVLTQHPSLLTTRLSIVFLYIYA